MKNILLLGDSIRIGYDKSVKETLEGYANVYFPAENCRFAAYVLRTVIDWITQCGLKGEEYDVVHWNAGLWDSLRLFGEDVQTPIDIYAYYIDRVCIRLKKLFPNAKLIFATSTSVQEEKMHNDFKRYNKDIEEYNRVAVEIAKKHGCEIDDLHAVSVRLPEEAHSDTVHYYTPIGTEAFTNQVVSCLCSAIGLEERLVYRERLHTDKPVGI